MSRLAPVLAAALLVLGACDGGSGDGSVNAAEEAGLTRVVAAEVAAIEAGGGRRWVTVNDSGDASRLAATLDDTTSLVDRPECTPDYEVSFFLDDGTRVDYAYGCAGEDLLWGTGGKWEGRAAVAPGAFTSEMAGYLALLVGG